MKAVEAEQAITWNVIHYLYKKDDIMKWMQQEVVVERTAKQKIFGGHTLVQWCKERRKVVGRLVV